VSGSGVSSSWHALGTTVGLVVRDGGAHADARRAVEDELAAIDAACSRFRADSELTTVNAAAGRPVRVSPVLIDALDAALRAAVITDGRVDPTVGRALELAGYDRDFVRVRGSRVRRIRVAPVAGWRVVELDREAGTVRVPAGVSLDLGATAKALAADRAAERAMAAASRARGVLVNLGGDIATAGAAPPAGWAVRVADSHRAGPDAPGQELRIRSGGLSTSSTTVRRWRRRGGDAHHIVDPRTGAPAVEHWRTVSVAALTCVDANIASTAAIVLGPEAPEWLADAGLPARLVTVSGAVVTTEGWPAEQAVAA
jgi:FAD:protein FMN transferase